MPEKKKAPKALVPEWVVTFGDLMSLLLCFFVLLVSFSEMKKPREYQKVIDSINEAMGFKGGMGLAHLLEQADNSMVSNQEERARRDGNERSTNKNNDDNVQGRETLVNIVQEGARHAIGGSIMFEVGEFELSKRNQDMIRESIAPKIRGLNYICPIVGHAWGLEEKRSGLGFDELGYRRAQSVKDFLVRECGVDAAILRIESAGDTEPMSLNDGSGQAGGSNRRVQVYQTGRTVSQTHPDPNFTGAGN
ncbi:MAG: OmpA family protein [Phycisphaerales bacterium]|nr:OmpA family protein [Phycisphaerales bacterium]